MNAPMNLFQASVKNCGKTPAQVLGASLRFTTMDNLEDLPTNPAYGTITPYEGLLLVPQDSFGIQEPLAPNPTLNEVDGQAVMNGTKHVYAFGIVKYKDVYGKNHETRVGYRYYFPQGGLAGIQKPIFQRYGSLAYNKAT
jgi:hypothetical protein